MRILKGGLPFLVAVAGVALVTALIAALRAWVDVPSLAVAYLIGVLLLGARWGRLPAIVAAVLAFGAYDFFFVPPVGTLVVSAPRELLNLVVLLVGAVAGGQLAAGLGRSRIQARAAAAHSATLSEVAMEALRATDVASALELVIERCARLASVEAVSIAGLGAGAVVAGPALNEVELRQARWSWENQTSVGLRLAGGRLLRGRRFPDDESTAYLPLTSGTAVIRWSAPSSDDGELELLAALLALAGLLLDRRRADLEASRARELAAADSLKATVLSSLSHELKSPLASLRAGLTSLSMPQSGLGGEQRELVLGLDREASRLDRLVGDLLNMSRLEAGLGLDLRPISYAELLGAVVQRLAGQLEPFRVEIEVPRELPPVLADELQIDRLVTNLLQNAVEWTSAGGRIGVGASAAGRNLRAWVDNEGPAIPPADLDSVFHKFWTGRSGGSGLGLAMARQIAEAHGGSIRAQNLRGGPRFTFTLPLAVAMPLT